MCMGIAQKSGREFGKGRFSDLHNHYVLRFGAIIALGHAVFLLQQQQFLLFYNLSTV